MITQDDHSADDISLIGEYALHLLDTDERRAVDARLANDPALQRLLISWQDSFASLADEISDVTPPAHIKAKIEARLFAQAQSNPAPSAPRWLHPIIGFMFAAALIIALIYGPRYFGNFDTFDAKLETETGGLVVSASYDRDATDMAVHKIEGTPDAGRVYELWLIPNGAETPISLGVLSSAEHRTIQIPDAVRDAVIGGTLAISDEPTGGSSTGAPTGTVLATGVLNKR